MLQQQTALHRADGPSSLRAVPDQQERESMRGRGSPCAETKCARAETQWTEPWWHYRTFISEQAQLHPSSRGASQARRVVAGPPHCGETQRPDFRSKTLSQSKFSFRVKSSQVKSSQGCRMVVCCLCIDLTRDSFRHPRTPARRIYLQMFTSDRGENTREAGHTVTRSRRRRPAPSTHGRTR